MGTWTSTPRTWVAGEIPTAAMFNSNLRDFGRAFSDAFTSYTPVLKDSTNATLANWTLTGAYLQAGKLVMVVFDITAQASPGVGTGVWRVDLPVSAKTTGPARWQAGQVIINDAAPTSLWTSARVSIDGAAYFSMWYFAGTLNAAQTGVGGGAPFTWAVNDRIVGSFWYEAA